MIRESSPLNVLFQEETGLEVRAAVTSERVLCLWESVFPYILSMGQPRRHHVVVYLHLGLATTVAELQDRQGEYLAQTEEEK